MTVMIIVAVLWNEHVGISWQPALVLSLIIPGIFLVVAAIYSTLRPAPVIAEVLFYVSLWNLFPIFGTRLTYLCTTVGYNLSDAMFANWDAALGFHWGAWAKFVYDHPFFLEMQRFSYTSYWWQPILVVLVSAIWKPRERNAEVFTALAVSMIATLAIATFVPAIGPADALGFEPAPAWIIRALQSSPAAQRLPYQGIVSFPSFHMVMAVLFAYACRGMRWVFPAAVGFNVLMAISIPYGGDHYLVDVLAGAAVAGVSILIARWISAVRRRINLSLDTSDMAVGQYARYPSDRSPPGGKAVRGGFALGKLQAIADSRLVEQPGPVMPPLIRRP
jgi:small basic protein